LRITESLAAPLIEATRQQFQQQLAAKDADIAKKEEALRAKQEQLARDREAIEDQVATRLGAQRSQIMAAEGKKAREAAAAELESKNKELTELQQEREQDRIKLAAAQQAQAEFLRKERELADAKRELDLTVEQRVQASLTEVHAKARRGAPVDTVLT
jgi:hypothetical protein